MTKSCFALKKSIEILAEKHQLYFWTFTTISENPPKQTVTEWRKLSKTLVRKLGFSGIRVFELHPNGHGLHVHVICTKYINVNQMRKCLVGGYWGRVHVTKVDDTEHSVNYMAKYVAKTKRVKSLSGVRIWAKFGSAYRSGVSVKNVKCRSQFGDVFHNLNDEHVKSCFPEFRDYDNPQKLALIKMRIVREYLNGRIHDLIGVNEHGLGGTRFVIDLTKDPEYLLNREFDCFLHYRDKLLGLTRFEIAVRNFGRVGVGDVSPELEGLG